MAQENEKTDGLQQDFPLSEVPVEARKSLFSTAVVLLGFTFFTATMWGGGKLGVAYDFISLLGVVALGNLLLGLYVAILGYIAFKSGLNAVLLGRFGFGGPASRDSLVRRAVRLRAEVLGDAGLSPRRRDPADPVSEPHPASAREGHPPRPVLPPC